MASSQDQQEQNIPEIDPEERNDLYGDDDDKWRKERREYEEEEGLFQHDRPAPGTENE